MFDKKPLCVTCPVSGRQNWPLVSEHGRALRRRRKCPSGAGDDRIQGEK